MGLTQNIMDYIIDKKQTNERDNNVKIKSIEIDLHRLMYVEDSERLVAVFLEDYMPETFSTLPSEKMLTMSFGYNDDLDMVGEMLIKCAELKHQERIRNLFESSKEAEKPYSVMFYDEETKRLAGGLTVYQEKPQRVVNIVSERERQKRLQAMKDNNVM